MRLRMGRLRGEGKVSMWGVGLLGVLLAPGYAWGLAGAPAMLRVDGLVSPLGIDSVRPMFSWQLRDDSVGARQTAYEVEVFAHAPGSGEAKADVWDSGKIASGVAMGVAYNGPALRPETRYWWRVTVWDKDGTAYAKSAMAWWETGLMEQANWHSAWIGYETAELHSVRESGARWITNVASEPTSPKETQHAFRLHVVVDKPVTRAVLYATGEDTAAAWINGRQEMETQPLPPWQQMPWGTYRSKDVTQAVKQGDNLLAIGVTRYKVSRGASVAMEVPMSACLYLEFADGTTRVVTTGPDTSWKAMLNAPEGWWAASFDDASWQGAKEFRPSTDPFGGTDTGQPWPTGPVAALRHEFTPASPVVSARLYATAFGAYKFYLNGSAVGDQRLAPGWMDFREHMPYQVYDVTAQMRNGKNTMAALLAPGWYSTPLRWFRQGNNYGTTQPSLRAQLRLEHADGSVEWVATDGSWKAETSPILQAEIYDGETRDARLEQAGWDGAGKDGAGKGGAGFKDGTWKQAMVVEPKVPRIVAQYFEPIRDERVMTAKAITSPKPGVYVVDFGQNMSAVPLLRVKGRRGDDVQLRFAEVLNPDGTIYVDNLRTAKATDHFVLAGGKAEVFEPLFTFHGFRYAEITGGREKPTEETLKAVVIHTDAPMTARFDTGDGMVNKLWSAVMWGQRSNFVGVPTDCPQRDERLGWSADAQVFWRTATFNMDLTTFSQKYAADLHGTQVGTAMYGIFAPGIDKGNPGYGAAWSDAGVIVPWTGWVQSGDTRIVDASWDGMVEYLAELERKNPDHLWRQGLGATFGDWLTPTITTPEDLLATAYWALDARMMEQMAAATGRTAEAKRYATMFDTIRTAFQKAYVRPDGTVETVDRYPSIPPPTVHPTDEAPDANREIQTQTAYVLALHMDLVPHELRAAAAEKLVAMIEKNHFLLGTGFLGTPYLLEVLSDTGHSDLAYRLLLNKDYPSWGYLIEHGATTTWERWNGDTMRADPSMNSYNHYAYGAVAEWMYRYAAGVDTITESPGFQTIRLHPNFDARLGHLSFDYDSAQGTVHSAWAVVSGTVTWHVTIPANTTAMLDTEATNAREFQVGGAAIASSAAVKATGEAGAYMLPAGSYTFTAKMAGVPGEMHASR